MKTEEKNRTYSKPTMQIVMLQQQTKLLTGSSLLNSTREDYGEAEIIDWV